MSKAHHPDFTAFGAILRTFQVMREEFLFFAILITLYVVISTVPYLFLFDGVDLTDPTVFMELALNDQPYFLVLSLAYYLLYAVFVVYILDRTNANLNNYSLNEYPYVKRAAMSAAPVILIYLITMILTSLGLVLLIVPGLIVLAGLYLAIPAKLAENISFLSAIPRSWELTKGHRLGIWGVLLIPLIPILIISFLGMFCLCQSCRRAAISMLLCHLLCLRLMRWSVVYARHFTLPFRAWFITRSVTKTWMRRRSSIKYC